MADAQNNSICAAVNGGVFRELGSIDHRGILCNQTLPANSRVLGK